MWNLQDCANSATTLGVLVALGIWILQIRNDKINRARDRFDRLSQQYVDYLMLFANDPKLHDSLLYTPKAEKIPPEERPKWVQIEIVICMIETAFHQRQLASKSGDRLHRNFDGWREFGLLWGKSDEFKKAVAAEILSDYGDETQKLLNGFINGETNLWDNRQSK